MGIHGIEGLKPHDDGIFPHKCEEEGCDITVQFDDEPKCFKHSPDSGSSVRGYSARAKAEASGDAVVVHRNIFEK